MISHMINRDGNVTFVAQGRQYFVQRDHPNYQAVLDGIRSDIAEQDLVDLAQLGIAVNNYLVSFGDIEVCGSQVVYTDEQGNKEILHGTVVDRILNFMQEGLPVQPLINFVRKMLQNPSYRSAKEGYDFLEHKNLPICEDGDFLAYKAVTHDYRDKRTGRFDNTPSQLVQEPRRQVDDNRDHACSNGLHVGTLDYVNTFGNFNQRSTSDKCVIVKVNPANIVSVPLHHECQKMRVCEYRVLRDFEGELDYQLATDHGKEFTDNIVDSLVIGDEIMFEYHDEQRHLEVEELDDDRVKGILMYPEAHEGDFRCFLKHKMSNVEFCEEEYEEEDDYDDYV